MTAGDFIQRGGSIRVQDASSNDKIILDSSSGDVGIGTTSPSAKLEVSGNAVVSGTINEGGELLKDKYTLQGTTEDLSGRVDTLENEDNLTLSGGGTITGETIFNTDTNTKPLNISRLGTKSENLQIGVEDGITKFYYKNDEADASIRFRIENTDTETGEGADANDRTILTMVSDETSGRVGIGTNSPSAKLEIRQDFDDDDNAIPWTALLFHRHVKGDMGNGDEEPIFIDFKWKDDNKNNYPQARIGALLNPDGETGFKEEGRGALVFYTAQDTTEDDGESPGLNERMRIDQKGNVGIGTTSPSSKLEIKNITGTPQTLLKMNVGNSPHFNFETVSSNDGWSFNQGFIGHGLSLKQSGSKEFVSQSDGANVYASGIGFSGNQGLTFYTLQNGNDTDTDISAETYERMRIDRKGNVGIGTTSPSATLDVSGNAVVSGTISEGGTLLNYRYSGLNSNINILFANQDYTYLFNNQSRVEYIQDKGVAILGKNNAIQILSYTPIHPNKKYYLRTDVKLLNDDDTGSHLYIGVASYDEKFSPLSTDDAKSYNYSLAANKFIKGTDGIITYEAVMEGYNSTTGTDVTKFDPYASYFRLVFYTRYSQTDDTNVKLLLDRIEIKAFDDLINDSNGNVGIGTDSPGARLDVDGDIRLTSNNTNSRFTIRSTDSNDFTPGGNGMNNITFDYRDLSDVVYTMGKIQMLNYSTDGLLNHMGTGDRKFRMAFYTADSSSNLNQGMVINESGNVGIGTVSPDKKLHIKGDDEMIKLEGTDNPYISFYNGSSTRTWTIGTISSSNDHYYIFDPSGNGGDILLASNKLGNVGIGTDSPGARLDVDGNVRSRSGSDHAQLTYFGVEFNRIASYLRPTVTDATATLYVGFAPHNKRWKDIYFDSIDSTFEGDVNINGDVHIRNNIFIDDYDNGASDNKVLYNSSLSALYHNYYYNNTSYHVAEFSIRNQYAGGGDGTATGWYGHESRFITGMEWLVHDGFSRPRYMEYSHNGNLILFTGTFKQFTGAHDVYQENEVDLSNSENNYGKIVRSTGKIPNVSLCSSLPFIELCTKEKDKSVIGVMVPPSSSEKKYSVNSIGEGGIWITDINDKFENGDYITSSIIPGYGQLQGDDLLHNYTVAKILMECDFTAPLEPKLITKTEKVKKIDESNNEYEEDQPVKDMNGKEILIEKLDASGNVVMEPAYEMRYLQIDGVEITKEEYETRRASGDMMVYRAAFVGCTYHCG